MSVGAIALGTLALVVSVSILNGYEERILDTATSVTSHIEVRSAASAGITLTSAELDAIQDLDDVKRVDRIITCEALARTRNGFDGVLIHGIPNNQLQSQLANLIVSGSLPKQHGCAVGQELARRLGLAVGDTLLLYASNSDHTTPIMFTSPVSAVVSAGMQSLDASLVGMNVEYAAQQLRIPNSSNALAITLHNPERAQRVAIRLLTMLPRGYSIITWKDRFASISNWIALQKKPIPIVLGLISIVAGFTVISTLLVSVILKTRSLATLASLGLSPNRLAVIILLRALRLGITGSLLGTALSLLLIWLQNEFSLIKLNGTIYYVSSLPVSLAPEPFVLFSILSIALSALAAIVPMWMVRRIPIVRALQWR